MKRSEITQKTVQLRPLFRDGVGVLGLIAADLYSLLRRFNVSTMRLKETKMVLKQGPLSMFFHTGLPNRH